MSASGDRVVTAIMLTIFTGMLVIAADYPADARLLPLLAGTSGAVLCLLHLFPALIEVFRRSQPAEPPTRKHANPRREIAHIAWFIVFLAGILMFGFLAASPVLVFAFIAIGGRDRWIVAAGLALGCVVTLYGVFELIFRLPLFPGLAITWLSG